VFTIHDLTGLLFPRWHLRLNRFFLQLMLPRFLQRADAIIADSDSTRRDVIARLRVPADKIEVVHLAADPSFCVISDAATRERIRNAYALPESFFLYLGTIEPRKNLVLLMDAYRDVVSHCDGAPDLVLAGKPGWQHAPVAQRAHELGLQQRVHFTGWVPAQDAPVLINLAHAFVYPSLYEGFGLPPLEAMQCGTPVICSNASSLPEVMGDAGLLIDPHDAAELGRAMMRLWREPALQETLRARGLARAAMFSWQRTARATLAVYERAARQEVRAYA
jgi:glycosyltransferase involved in cell wall biosynthesis